MARWRDGRDSNRAPDGISWRLAYAEAHWGGSFEANGTDLPGTEAHLGVAGRRGGLTQRAPEQVHRLDGPEWTLQPCRPLVSQLIDEAQLKARIPSPE